jgi:DNA-binding NtrC family response regulator
MKDEAARILVVDDERLIRWSLDQQLRREGYEVRLAETGAEALQAARTEPPDLVLLDMRLPDADGVEILERLRALDPQCPVIMITAHGAVGPAVRAMKLGAQDYLVKPVDPDELRLAIRKALEARSLRRQVTRLQAEAAQGSTLDDLVGVSRAVKSLRATIRQIAGSETTTVLLQGESGTGKDLVARVIHFASARAPAPFQAVNCVALPEHLLESELFGYEKGAFTGAVTAKPGRFELANGGTLFLDEVGDISLGVQVKLLRVLQERRFERLGGTRSIDVDVRVVAATNRDLQQLIVDGSFREDLFYRLNVVPITLPPLRQRRGDIPRLVAHFLDKYEATGRTITNEAMEALTGYPWPGNIRELENTIERVVILASAPEIGLEDLPSEVRAGIAPSASRTHPFELPEEGLDLEEVEMDLLRQAMDRAGGSAAKAAKLVGLTPKTLEARMHRLGLQ